MGIKKKERFIEDLAYFKPNLQLISEYTGALGRVEVVCTRCNKTMVRYANSLLTDRKTRCCADKDRTHKVPEREEFLKFFSKYGAKATCIKYGVSNTKFYEWCKTLNIDTSRSFRNRIDKDEFIKDYTNPHYNMVALEMKYGVSKTTIRQLAREYGITKFRNKGLYKIEEINRKLMFVKIGD